MAALATFPSGVLRALPPVARAMLREQRRQLLSRATGRALDLGDGADQSLLGGADEIVCAPSAYAYEATAGDDDEGSFDAIVSVLHLATVADLPAELAAVRRLLTPEGRLLFLEPVRQPGFGGRLRSAASPVVRLASGWRVDRDIPLAIRSNHLTIVDIERITMPPIVWPVRAFVLGAAARPAGEAEGPSGPAERGSR